jgi:hypothetical protein
LKRTAKSLQTEYNEIERLALKEFVRIYHVNGIGMDKNRSEEENRRDFAMEATKTEYRSILFKLYDKRPYDDIIWKSIRPTYSKPFKDGYVDDN